MHNNNIKELLLIIDKMEKKIEINEEERKLAANTLNQIVTWAYKAAKKLDIPIEIVR